MVFVDSNALVVLIIGLMDIRLLKDHNKTSIYESEDFYNLSNAIVSLDNILTTPHVLTETDNLLNKFSGHHKYTYVKTVSELIKKSSERFIKSLDVIDHYHFSDLGLTDSVILHLRPYYNLLITADSALSDHARSLEIPILDLVAYRNNRLIN